MLVNALRGHMAEFGLIEAQGLHKVAGLIAIVMDDMDERIPEMARQALKVIAGQINELQTRIAALETQVLEHVSTELNRGDSQESVDARF